MASAAARAQKSDWPTTIPAKNAPKTMEAPKNSAEHTATPSAMTSTASVNKSRAPVRATYRSTSGMTFFPANSVRATSRASLTNIQPSSERMPPQSPAPLWRASITAGMRTSSRMVNRSSTTSHPRATWPPGVWRFWLSSSTRVSTTVLATEIAMPKTSPEIADHPNIHPTSTPSTVATDICTTAPGTATFCTAIKSFKWKWSPTPNISRITPSSANCSTVWESATNPGEYGPTATPASR